MAELLMNLMAATSPSVPLTTSHNKPIKSSETLTSASISEIIIPDLSHLNENERPIIESVILRQRKEEEEEAQLLKHKQNEVLLLEELIRKRNEEHLRDQGNVDLDATCQICLKTKFADGIGHRCNYCNTKCCARCGGKVTLRSNKNIWACIVCRKKQELLIKTGQWIHSSKNTGLKQLDSVAATPTTETPLLERILNFGSVNNTESTQSQPLRSSLNFIRRNSLGMFPSFSSINSNVTLSPLSSSITVQKPRLLKRQLSHEPTTDTLNYLGLHQTVTPLQKQQFSKSRQWLSQTMEQQFNEENFTGYNKSARKRHILPRQPSLPISHQLLPSSHVSNQTQSSQTKKVPLDSSQLISAETCTTTGYSQLTTGSGRKLPTQRQKSRELPSLDDIVLMKTTQFQDQQQQLSTPSKLPIHTIKKLPQLPDRSNNSILIGAPIKTNTSTTATICVPSGSSSTPNIALPISQPGNNQLLSSYSRSYSGGDTTIANTSKNIGILNQRMFLSAGSLVRNDSIGSDPGDVRKSTPPPSAFVRQLPSTNQRLRLRDHLIMHHVYHRSFSSSEDNTDGGCGGGETRSLTPELSTEDDFDLFDSCESSGIVSGQLSSNSLLPPRRGRLLPRSNQSGTLKCEDILESKMKNFLVHPITWEKSADGTQMVCRMTLKKNYLPDSGLSSSAMLGMKVVGGRIVEAGRLGAIVEKVKKGSIADTIGRLKPRDEVLEWNNISLKGKTYDEVHDIIADSKHHTQIDLVVARPLPETISGSSSNVKPLLRCPLVQMSSTSTSHDELLIQQQNKRIGRRHTDVISSTAQPRSLDIVDKNAFFTRGSSLGAEYSARQMRTTPYVKVTRSPTITGRIQVKLYYDGQTLELFVTIMNAIDLSPRKTGLLRNPYCTIYLLPDQTEKTLRKTTTVINTLEPIWNQTFQYSPLSSQDIRTRALELTVCDYDHFLSVEFLGATIIELQHVQMDDEPEWYCLTTREDLQQHLRQQLISTYKLSAETSTGTSGVGGCGLSPPTHSATSISARLSDSDVASELSMDDFDSKADSWRCLLADTSQSGSIGSGGSGSSPPLGVNSMDTLGMGDIVGGGASGLGGRRFRTYLQQPQTGSSGSLSYHHHYHHISHQRLPLVSLAGTSTSVLHHPKIYYSSTQQQSTTNQSRRNLPFPLSVSSLPNSSTNVYSGSIAISNSSTNVTMVTPINSGIIIPPSAELRKGSLQLIGNKTSNQNKLVSQSSLNYPSSGSKKRHLPLIPNMAATFGGSARSMQQQKSIDQLTPPIEAMYSDSEITIRPVFGNRPLYAHPVSSMPTSRRYHALQQQQSISLDDVDYYRSPNLIATSAHEVQSESELSSSGHNRSQQQASYHNQPHSDNQQHYGRHRSSIISSTVDYRELKDYNNQRRTSYHPADVDADGEEDETEFDDDKEGQYRNHRSRHYYRKESNGSRRESMPKGELSAGCNSNNVAGVIHHRSSIHRKNSRRKREQQQPPASEQDGDDSEEETESSSAHNRHSNNNRQYLQNQLPSISSQQPFDLMPPTQPGALPSRPKGSRTLSEFTSHRGQQHSAPVHPPHPSRSSLAVARSLSERSKEDKSLESSFSDVPTTGGPKSYSDQIDEVMEQLNANCDFSMDDLFNDTNSTLASNYNVQQTADGKGGKKKMPHGQTGLTKKSNSASQLSVTGTKKRLGFRKNKQQTSFSVHRSEEVLPDEVRHLVKQYSSLSSDGEGSVSGESSSIAAWMPATSNRSNNPTQTTTSAEGEFSNFVEGLGPGQIVGRQALAASNLGDIQLSLHDRKGHLEVEVIRARGLQSSKQKAKIIPAPFVKVYMLRNGKCVYKAKTQMARRTLDPLFQQQLLFTDNYKGCILHVVVNGLYGRMDKKFFMGAVQIVLDDLDLTNIVIGWYKLFNESSAISLPQSSKGGSSGGSGGGMGGVGSGGSISGATSLMSASMESFN